MEEEKNGEETEVDMDIKGGSFKEIVMIHLARITMLYSTELRGGYFSITQTKTGDTKEIYVADSRESLSNSIYCMAQLLIPKFDKDMTIAFDKFRIDNQKLKEDFLKTTKINDKEVLGEGYYEENEKPLLETYKIQKLNLYKELFTELSKLLSRKKYLGMSMGTY